MAEHDSIVLCDNLVKIYKVADLEVVALQGLDLDVHPGEIIALVGPSGSGKSTLLNVIGGLDTPSAGSVSVAGFDLLSMKEKTRVIYKRNTVGFAWQQPSRNLLPYLTARENVEMPMLLNGIRARERRNRARELLDMLGLSDRENFKPDRLSGGQQQRVALAVALANNPPVLLGDELTGQIDSQSASEVFEALRNINKNLGTTIIIVTHDPNVAGSVDRVVAIRDGRISTEIRRQWDGQQVQEEEWVILDKAGRLQIPAGFVDKLYLKDRVKMRLDQDHVSVWPEQTDIDITMKQRIVEQVKKPIFNDDEESQKQGSSIRTEKLWRTFSLAGKKIHAVREVDLAITPGSVAVFRGRSGSGKTTLLNLIAGLDRPTNGKVYFDGRDLQQMREKEVIELRRRKIGFVYQTFGLLPFLSGGENVEIPLRLIRSPNKFRQSRVRMMLELVGLENRINHRTFELSGGEQQRVAIARALVNRPTLLLADEPTGQLDTVTGEAIFELLRQIATQFGVTVLIASHDPKALPFADVVYNLIDGQIQTEEHEQYKPPEPIRKAMALLKGGRVEEAQKLLVDLIKKDNTEDQAWYLLSFTISDPYKKKFALEQALLLNPNNKKALKQIAKLKSSSEPAADR